VVINFSSSDHCQDSLARLEQELATATAQLEEYQRLIDEMPGIYEVKFGSQLRDVAQDIRLLMQERHDLQRQLQHCLEGQAPSSDVVMSSQPRPSWPLSKLAAGAQRRLVNLKAWQLALAAAASTLVLALLIHLATRLSKGYSPPLVQPVPGQPKSNKARAPAAYPPASIPQLRLRARGEVWLELRSLNGTSVFQGTLQQGQELVLPLGDGLRIRSGRPHLLEIALPRQSFAPLAAANDYSWRTFAAPAPGVRPSERSVPPREPS
jgi:hypothetical protein